MEMMISIPRVLELLLKLKKIVLSQFRGYNSLGKGFKGQRSGDDLEAR